MNPRSVSFLLLSLTAMVYSTAISKRQINVNLSLGGGSFQSKDEKSIVNSIMELALDISSVYWEKGHTGNVVQSPLSISGLLSMLLLAARGNSYSELKRVLTYPNDMSDKVIHETFKKILDSLEQTSSGVDIDMSSRLFLQEKLSILSEFTRMVEDSYYSKVTAMDFATSPSETMNSINKWVEQSTFGEIKNLITSPFSPSTKFVAANVVYFNGEWENPFSDRITKNGLFDTGIQNISVPMMTTIMTVPFLKGDNIGFDMIALPYKGGKYSMYILTPLSKPGVAGIQRLEYSINSNNIDILVGQMKTKKVSVTIPRMKLSQKLYLKEDLQTLGVNSIFDRTKADFGRLTTETGIFVDDIVHEAVLEITETGTVAAAASAATIDRIGGNEVFQLNKPSLLFIRDNQNGLILFWARVMKPEGIPN